MALIKCHECAHEVSTAAKACPHCGAKVRHPKHVRGGWLIIVAAIVVVFLIASTESPPPDPEQSARADAAHVCQRFVRERLKAPDSAEFQPAYQTGVSGNTQSGRYVATGYVDAVNSFGAKLRNTYRCEMQLSGDQWLLRDIRIGSP